MGERTVIIVHDTIWQSFAKDAGTFVMISCLI